jgi:glycosyltransferase involved in cell wall biosynthesis
MEKIIVLTQAHNSEKTLSRTIESVLKQSYTNFVYHIIDNDSDDHTGAIALEYAQKDDRIVYIHNDSNRFTAYVDYLSAIQENYGDECAVTMVDADDSVLENYLETCVTFMEKENLDIAACGLNFIHAQSSNVVGQRILPTDRVILKDKICANYSECYEHMYTVTGKIFKISLLKKCDFGHVDHIKLGSGTLFAYEAIRNAERFGIMNKALYNHFMWNDSASTIFYPERIDDVKYLFESIHKFLLSYGPVSNENYNTYFRAYLMNIQDVVSTLLNGATMPCAEKLEIIRHIFEDTEIKSLFMEDNRNDMNKFSTVYYILRFIINDRNMNEIDHLVEFGDTLVAINEAYPCFPEIGQIHEALKSAGEESTIPTLIAYVRKYMNYRSIIELIVLLGQKLATFKQDSEAYAVFAILMALSQYGNNLEGTKHWNWPKLGAMIALG